MEELLYIVMIVIPHNSMAYFSIQYFELNTVSEMSSS